MDQPLPSPLLRRGPILPNESLSSYLRRMARLNLYAPPSLLMYTTLRPPNVPRIRDRVDRPQQALTYARISALTAVPIPDLHAATPHRFAPVLTPPDAHIPMLALPDGTLLPLIADNIMMKQFRPDKAGQFCPACLAEQVGHRNIWLPSCVTACLRHRCLLHTRCPACHYAVSIEMIAESRCEKCKTDLSDAPPFDITDDVQGLRAQEVVQGWLTDDPHLNVAADKLPDQPPRVLYRVLEGLSWAAASAMPTFEIPENAPSAHVFLDIAEAQSSPYRLHSRYRQAFVALCDWPTNLYALLDSIPKGRDTQKRAKNTSLLMREFGTLYTRRLAQHWQHPAFAFVQDAFTAYFIDRYGDVPSLARHSFYRDAPERLNALPYMTESEACDTLRVAPQTLNRLVAAGHIRQHVTDNDEKALLVRADVLRAREERREYLNLTDAAHWLGTSEDVVRGLHERGILVAEETPAESGGAWGFAQANVQKLLDRVRAEVITEEAAQGMTGRVSLVRPFLSLTAAAQACGILGLNAADLVVAVVRGELPVYALPEAALRLSALLFHPGEIDAFLDEERQERGYLTNKETATLLGIKEATLAKWVAIGLVAPKAEHGSAHYFDADTIGQFWQVYATTEEAARIVGVGAPTILRWAKREDWFVKPLSGPTIDGCQAYLFRRSEVKRWRHNHLTFGETMKQLGVSKPTLHRWCKEGRITPIHTDEGKHRWFTRADVD